MKKRIKKVKILFLKMLLKNIYKDRTKSITLEADGKYFHVIPVDPKNLVTVQKCEANKRPVRGHKETVCLSYADDGCVTLPEIDSEIRCLWNCSDGKKDKIKAK